MVTTTLLLATIILSVCLAGETCSKEDDCDCGLVGTWTNQLGSEMNITSCKKGQLEGKYNSAVGEAEKVYTLSGRYTSGPKGSDNVLELGWVVSWNNEHGNSHSATAWSGIYYPDDKVIRTQWLLTSFAKQKDYWKTTTMNHDEFRPKK